MLNIGAGWPESTQHANKSNSDISLLIAVQRERYQSCLEGSVTWYHYSMKCETNREQREEATRTPISAKRNSLLIQSSDSEKCHSICILRNSIYNHASYIWQSNVIEGNILENKNNFLKAFVWSGVVDHIKLKDQPKFWHSNQYGLFLDTSLYWSQSKGDEILMIIKG